MSNSESDAGTELIEDFFPEDPASNPEPKKAAPVEQKPAEKPKHPAYLVKAAKNLQFTDAEISEYSTTELKDAIQIVNMTRTQDRKEQQVMQEVQRDAQTGRFVKQEEAPVAEPEFSLKELGIDSSKWTAETTTEEILTAALKPITQKYQKLIESLEEKINGLNEREQTRERESELDKLDQLFVKDEAIFGKGSRFEMAKGSPEIRRRKAMIGAMSELFQTEKGISHKECYERAKEELFGGFQAKHEEKAEEVQEEVKTPARPRVDMTNGHTVQPTAKAHAPQPKGHKLAVQNLANRLKVPAINNGEPSEFDELPD